MAASKLSGCLRNILILVILITSISTAIFYVLLQSNLYKLPKDKNSGVFFKNIEVFDGEKVLGETNVRVEGEVITCVGPDCKPLADTPIIEGKGKSLIPGLADLHVHFYAPSVENSGLSTFRQLFDYVKQRPQVRKNLHAAGITAIRSVGDIPANILKLRLQIEKGDLAGPEVYCTGPLFTAPDGHPAGTIYKGNPYLIENGTRQVKDGETARKEVESLAALGVNGIKAVYDDAGGKIPKLDSAVLKIIITTAHEKNLWVTVHTGTAADVAAVTAWGADAIEHGTEEPLPDRVVQMMVEKQILYIPTLSIMETQGVLERQPGRFRNIQRLDSAGVMMGAGTDTQGNMTFGNSLHRELELLVKAGLSPEHALRAATFYAAISLKTDHEKGLIAVGKQADLVLIQGRPWQQIEDIRKIEAVWQKGIQVK
ncbi:MAG: amidohydrolase family protein [Bacteroidia bacterium]|nr:amidohydrolase family protein [Bacteroidia bacterium]